MAPESQKEKFLAHRRPPHDLWPSCTPPPGSTTGTHAGTPLLLSMPVGWGLLSRLLLPSVHLAGQSRLGWAPRPALPPLTSADFSSPSPGLPEQAACVWGREGLWGEAYDASYPGQPASQRGFGAGGGMEPGMAELAAVTGWIFTGNLYLG